MKKTFVLTSFVALTIATQATSAMADYTENSQYGETCSVGNIGAYDSSTSIAVAHFALNTHNCDSGYYLPADVDSCTICPAGSHCDSAGTYTFDSSASHGITACPNGYTNSDSGATASTQCYRVCTTSDILHSTGITGNVYYDGTNGDGVKTCVPTGCDSGYTADSGAPAPNLTESIGESAGTARGYINHSGTFSNGNTSGTAESFGISGNDTWAVDYGNGKGIITGKAICSTLVGYRDASNSSVRDFNDFNNPTTFDSLTPEFGTGNYCYCQIDSWTPSNGTKQSVSAPWVFHDASGSGGYQASFCTSNCAGQCAYELKQAEARSLGFRAAMFNSVRPTAPSCKANTITVRWGGQNGALFESNTCTYGGTLYTPTTAPAAPKGHHFTGWTFDLGN